MTLLEEFERAAMEVALDLGLNGKGIKIEHFEFPGRGLDYTAELFEDAKGFDFHLSTETEEKGAINGTMKASLTIYFEEGVAPFCFDENIDYVKEHSDFLGRWVAWAIFNYRQKHEKVDLETLFHDVDVRVYGIPGYGSPAEEEAELLFHGILATQESKVLIYKFRHTSKEAYLCRSFSYAVHVAPKRGYIGFWVIFPDNCGLDSGRGYSTYRHFESLIKMIGQKLEVAIRRYDVEYGELDRFLLRKASGFFSVLRPDSLERLSWLSRPSKVLEGSEAQFDRFWERFEKREYPQALRDLRALVQQAQENVAAFKDLDCSEVHRPNINKLASFLVEKGQIEGRLCSWFAAFTAIANMASHRNFPTEQDLQDFTLRDRVLLTFYLGMHLLEELDRTVCPPVFASFIEPS